MLLLIVMKKLQIGLQSLIHFLGQCGQKGNMDFFPIFRTQSFLSTPCSTNAVGRELKDQRLIGRYELQLTFCNENPLICIATISRTWWKHEQARKFINHSRDVRPLPGNSQLDYDIYCRITSYNSSSHPTSIGLFHRLCDRYVLFLHIALCLLTMKLFTQVNSQVTKPQERVLLGRLADIMVALELRFTQEKTEDGQLVYRLEP